MADLATLELLTVREFAVVAVGSSSLQVLSDARG
jgi:hypothetical protein